MAIDKNVRHHNLTAQAGTGAFVTGVAQTSPTQAANQIGANLCVGVNLTAIAGTPAFDVRVQWSFDGVNFGDAQGAADTFTQLVATGFALKVFTIKAPIFRVDYKGGASATGINATIDTWVP